QPTARSWSSPRSPPPTASASVTHPARPRSSIPLWTNTTATTGSFSRALPTYAWCVPGCDTQHINLSSKQTPCLTPTVPPCSPACNSTIRLPCSCSPCRVVFLPRVSIILVTCSLA